MMRRLSRFSTPSGPNNHFGPADSARRSGSFGTAHPHISDGFSAYRALPSSTKAPSQTFGRFVDAIGQGSKHFDALVSARTREHVGVVRHDQPKICLLAAPGNSVIIDSFSSPDSPQPCQPEQGFRSSSVFCVCVRPPAQNGLAAADQCAALWPPEQLCNHIFITSGESLSSLPCLSSKQLRGEQRLPYVNNNFSAACPFITRN